MSLSTKRAKLSSLLLFFQVFFLVLFAVFVRYDPNLHAVNHPWSDKGKGETSQIRLVAVPEVQVLGQNDTSNLSNLSSTNPDPVAEPAGYEAKKKHATTPTTKEWNVPTFDRINVASFYPMFQDVHVMIFIGFGFLMTFLKRYGFGSIGLNFLLAAFVIQWAILMNGFLNLEDGKILINIKSLIAADFGAAVVLITFGAVLGKASPVQLIIVAFLEIICSSVNEYICVHHLKVADVGGSMLIHAFGAYFGLALARVIYSRDIEDSTKEGSNYHSDLFSMIGTIFLWLYWPSFNAALATGDDQHRAVINTYLSLAACCVVTFAVSNAINKGGKLDMVHIQNSTLAGGVAIGTSADMMVEPWGAIIIGSVAGLLSVIGFTYITPFLYKRAKIHDTCGVNNLHGMPGILAGIAGAITAAIASTDKYGKSLYELFPARAPANGTELADIQSSLSGIEPGEGRSGVEQAGYQLLALVITLSFAMVGGTITGFILRIPFCNQPQSNNLFEDNPWWSLPDAEEGDVLVRMGDGSENSREMPLKEKI